MARRFFFRLIAAATPVGDHVPDAELLRRFARDRDPAAFELLVRRHAVAVWTACRRVLRSEADAEDAFQATFLVLARKAGSVRGACVGGWLYRVAVNAALKLRASGRRQMTVAEVPEQPADAGRSPGAEDLAAVVQEELARLPERYRLPVVLCDLEGHTHAEAAAALNWPVGSVSGRLSRARGILRDRLTRRGVTAPAVLVAVSGVSAAVVRDTAAAAVGAAAVPPSVSTLAQGVLSAMRTAKLKLTAVVLASAGLLGAAGVGTVLAWPRGGPPGVVVPKPDLPLQVVAPAPPDQPVEGDWLGNPPTAFPNLKLPEGPARDFTKMCPRLFDKKDPAIEPSDDTYRRLLKARLRQYAEYVYRFRIRLDVGQYRSEEFFNYMNVQRDMRAVALELWANDPKNLIPRLEELVLLAKEAERFTNARAQAGADPPQHSNQATAYRLEVEAALWRAIHPKPAK